jgi:hypothetical protein
VPDLDRLIFRLDDVPNTDAAEAAVASAADTCTDDWQRLYRIG